MATVIFANTNASFFIGPNQTINVWLQFDGWDKYHSTSAGPVAGSPAGASLQVITEWTTQDNKLWRTYHNNGSVGLIFSPKNIHVSP